jgi:endonuclease/exonuclease/phosphatase family metal-dependent hydrolase
MLHGFPRFAHLGRRLDVLASEIRRLDPDIVCLQEVPWRPGMGSAAEYLGRETGLNHLYLRANGNRWAILFEEGEAILSRYPLRDPLFAELRPRAAFFQHRVVLGATAETPWGAIQVFGTHLTHNDAQANRGQVADLETLVGSIAGSRPAIVAGDFNETEDSPQIRALGWTDTFRVANRSDPGATCCVDDVTAPPGEPFGIRIDYVFALSGGQELTVVESRRVFAEPTLTDGGWLWASDHAGVLTDLSFGGVAGGADLGG